MVAATTVSAIAAERMLSEPTWSGLPMAAGILGTAAGSQLLGRQLERFELRWVLASQYTVALLGGAMAVLAVLRGEIVLLGLGLAILGLGNGATQGIRYLAADLFPPARSPQVLSWVVWISGLGAALGPSLLAPSAGVARHLGLPEEAGPYLAVMAAFAACAVAYGGLLPKGVFAAPADTRWLADNEPRDDRLAASRWPPAARLALLAMVVGHVVMVFVMTMTPIHLAHRGHSFGAIGMVISAHLAGMFLFAPVAGWLSTRLGPGRVVLGGSLLLAFACLLAALNSASSSPDGPLAGASMSLPLFLLGLGWNFGFVGGSTLLNSRLPEQQRIRGRARADAAIWTAAAASSLLSSVLFARIGFAQLSWLGSLLALFLAVTLVWKRRSLV